MKKYDVKTCFTIAPAISPGINQIFARQGYSFGGRLINNTQISGRIESMNVWYKSTLIQHEAIKVKIQNVWKYFFTLNQ